MSSAEAIPTIVGAAHHYSSLAAHHHYNSRVHICRHNCRHRRQARSRYHNRGSHSETTHQRFTGVNQEGYSHPQAGVFLAPLRSPPSVGASAPPTPSSALNSQSQNVSSLSIAQSPVLPSPVHRARTSQQQPLSVPTPAVTGHEGLNEAIQIAAPPQQFSSFLMQQNGGGVELSNEHNATPTPLPLSADPDQNVSSLNMQSSLPSSPPPHASNDLTASDPSPTRTNSSLPNTITTNAQTPPPQSPTLLLRHSLDNPSAEASSAASQTSIPASSAASSSSPTALPSSLSSFASTSHSQSSSRSSSSARNVFLPQYFTASPSTPHHHPAFHFPPALAFPPPTLFPHPPHAHAAPFPHPSPHGVAPDPSHCSSCLSLAAAAASHGWAPFLPSLAHSALHHHQGQRSSSSSRRSHNHNSSSSSSSRRSTTSDSRPRQTNLGSSSAAAPISMSSSVLSHSSPFTPDYHMYPPPFSESDRGAFLYLPTTGPSISSHVPVPLLLGEQLSSDVDFDHDDISTTAVLDDEILPSSVHASNDTPATADSVEDEPMLLVAPRTPPAAATSSNISSRAAVVSSSEMLFQSPLPLQSVQVPIVSAAPSSSSATAAATGTASANIPQSVGAAPAATVSNTRGSQPPLQQQPQQFYFGPAAAAAHVHFQQGAPTYIAPPFLPPPPPTHLLQAQLPLPGPVPAIGPETSPTSRASLLAASAEQQQQATPVDTAPGSGIHTFAFPATTSAAGLGRSSQIEAAALAASNIQPPPAPRVLPPPPPPLQSAPVQPPAAPATAGVGQSSLSGGIDHQQQQRLSAAGGQPPPPQVSRSHQLQVQSNNSQSHSAAATSHPAHPHNRHHLTAVYEAPQIAQPPSILQQRGPVPEINPQFNYGIWPPAATATIPSYHFQPPPSAAVSSAGLITSSAAQLSDQPTYISSSTSAAAPSNQMIATTGGYMTSGGYQRAAAAAINGTLPLNQQQPVAATAMAYPTNPASASLASSSAAAAAAAAAAPVMPYFIVPPPLHPSASGSHVSEQIYQHQAAAAAAHHQAATVAGATGGPAVQQFAAPVDFILTPASQFTSVASASSASVDRLMQRSRSRDRRHRPSHQAHQLQTPGARLLTGPQIQAAALAAVATHAASVQQQQQPYPYFLLQFLNIFGHSTTGAPGGPAGFARIGHLTGGHPVAAAGGHAGHHHHHHHHRGHHGIQEVPLDMSYEALLNLAERLGEVKSRGMTRSDVESLPSYQYFSKKSSSARGTRPRKTAPPTHSTGATSSTGAAGSDEAMEEVELDALEDATKKMLEEIVNDSDSVSHVKEVEGEAEVEDDSSAMCVICMYDFEEEQMLRVLPCHHEFHSKCVDKWLKINRTCPICRSDCLHPAEKKTSSTGTSSSLSSSRNRSTTTSAATSQPMQIL